MVNADLSLSLAPSGEYHHNLLFRVAPLTTPPQNLKLYLRRRVSFQLLSVYLIDIIRGYGFVGWGRVGPRTNRDELQGKPQAKPLRWDAAALSTWDRLQHALEQFVKSTASQDSSLLRLHFDLLRSPQYPISVWFELCHLLNFISYIPTQVQCIVSHSYLKTFNCGQAF